MEPFTAGLSVYQGIKLGTAVATAVKKMIAPGEAGVEVTGATKMMGRLLGRTSGMELIQARAYKPHDAWLRHLMEARQADRADIAAAEDAVVATINEMDATRLALLTVADPAGLANELARRDASRRAGLLGEVVQLIYDRLLNSSMAVIRDLTPGPTRSLGQALSILHEWIIEFDFSGRFDALEDALGDLTDGMRVVAAGQQGTESAIEALTRTIRDEASDRYRLANEPADYSQLIRVLSPVRMRRFLDLSDGDEKEAMKLYQWNQQVSAQLYLAVHILEVVLRNAIDAQLRHFNAKQDGGSRGEMWMLNPCTLIQRVLITSRRDGSTSNRLEQALLEAQRVKRSSNPVSHDDVIAHAGLRTWRNLLPTSAGARGRFRNALWSQCLYRAFPNVEGSALILGSTVERIVMVRNRVAHLEPFLSTRRLRANYNDITFVLRALDSPAEQWFQSRQEIKSLLGHPLADRVALPE